MEVMQTKLNGCFLINPKVFRDNRGYFLESYSEKAFFEAGLTARFVQDNHSYSTTKGVVRGLHFQLPPHTQTKLVRVTRGKVLDVVVDMRRRSPTFGAWEGFELSAENFLMLYIPQGFAHGFCTLTDNVEFMYKNDDFYAPAHDGGIRWNDPDLKIAWPVENPVVSEKDSRLPFFTDFVNPF